MSIWGFKSKFLNDSVSASATITIRLLSDKLAPRHPLFKYDRASEKPMKSNRTINYWVSSIEIYASILSLPCFTWFNWLVDLLDHTSYSIISRPWRLLNTVWATLPDPLWPNVFTQSVMTFDLACDTNPSRIKEEARMFLTRQLACSAQGNVSGRPYDRARVEIKK